MEGKNGKRKTEEKKKGKRDCRRILLFFRREKITRYGGDTNSLTF